MDIETINTVLDAAWDETYNHFVSKMPDGEARGAVCRAIGYYQSALMSKMRHRDFGKE